jgi:hypothetical protein
MLLRCSCPSAGIALHMVATETCLTKTAEERSISMAQGLHVYQDLGHGGGPQAVQLRRANLDTRAILSSPSGDSFPWSPNAAQEGRPRPPLLQAALPLPPQPQVCANHPEAAAFGVSQGLDTSSAGEVYALDGAWRQLAEK